MERVHEGNSFIGCLTKAVMWSFIFIKDNQKNYDKGPREKEMAVRPEKSWVGLKLKLAAERV
jgi:hypothetical protein